MLRITSIKTLIFVENYLMVWNKCILLSLKKRKLEEFRKRNEYLPIHKVRDICCSDKIK